ncbi:MAG TPA: nitroreductase family protein [Methanoregula sp.]|nr:nitroreductase family protein [Methanoregula sp.]
MCSEPDEQKNFVLDQILAGRRSHRQFRPEIPPADAIARIIHAGLLAPYAAAAVGGSGDYFRRFFVIPNGSAGMQRTLPLVRAEVNAMAEELDREMAASPVLRDRAAGFVRRLAAMRKTGIVPGVGTAPYYIVVAERKGFPPVELQSLAHCMENMWLKATALCLGFQLVSITSRMAGNPAFCGILGIAPGEWELMGCAVGYAREELPPSVRPPVERVTKWLE